jgi:hypothetical protein
MRFEMLRKILLVTAATGIAVAIVVPVSRYMETAHSPRPVPRLGPTGPMKIRFEYTSDQDELFLLLRKSPNVRMAPAPVSWLDGIDMKKLVNQLESNEPCGTVMSDLSSSWNGTFQSTIGHESAYLIEGIRRKEFPFGLLGTDVKIDDGQLRKWLKERQEKTP